MTFSGANAFEDQLPEVGGVERAVVILRMRGRTHIVSTVIGVLERYARQLRARGGKLMLAGVSGHVMEHIRRTETTETIAEEDIFLASATLGAATQEAMAAAERWLRQQRRDT